MENTEDKITRKIQENAKNLLMEGKVDLVIGYEKVDNKKTSPSFVTREEDVSKLIWNRFCLNNLSVYLSGIGSKVAIVVKGCDSKALVELIKNNQIKREDLFILGVPCEGVVKEDGSFYEKCEVCRNKNPVLYDILLAEKIEEKSKVDKYPDVRELESLSREERLKFWQAEFGRCIRCYACKNICPICFCKECFVENKQSEWISKYKKDDTLNFHFIRMMHIAGRCVDCGECERACPMGIELRRLYRKVNKDVKDLFNHEAGIDLEEKQPLITFDTEKDEEIL